MGCYRSGGLFVFVSLWALHSFEVSRMSFILALIPRRCTEKILLAVSWMICAQNNALKFDFEGNGERRSGVFSFVAASSLPAWDSAVARPALPIHPFPLPDTFSLKICMRPCLPRVYSRPNETPQRRAPDRVLREKWDWKEVRARDQRKYRIGCCFSGEKSALKKLEGLETARGNTGARQCKSNSSE
jgi:hypothetical protein